MKDDINSKQDGIGEKADDSDNQNKTSPDVQRSELSIYVVKETRGGLEGETIVTYSVGNNGQTHLIDVDRAAAVEKIGQLLDEM